MIIKTLASFVSCSRNAGNLGLLDDYAVSSCRQLTVYSSYIQWSLFFKSIRLIYKANFKHLRLFPRVVEVTNKQRAGTNFQSGITPI